MEKPRPDLIKKISIHLAEEIENFSPKATEVEIITAIAMLAMSACLEAKLSIEHFSRSMTLLEQSFFDNTLPVEPN